MECSKAKYVKYETNKKDINPISKCPKGEGRSVVIELFSHCFYPGLFKNIMSLLSASLQF